MLHMEEIKQCSEKNDQVCVKIFNLNDSSL
jgi:hypothetical protein